MGKSVLGASNNVNVTATSYIAFGFSNIGGVGTEALRQANLRTAGTVSDLRAYINTNNSTGSITFRLNGAATALTISIGNGVTGWVSDLTNSVTLDSNDLICVQLIEDAAGTINIRTVEAIFSGTSVTATLLTNAGANSTSAASSTFYARSIGDPNGDDTSAANNEIYVPTAGTLRNFQLYINNNNRTTNTTYRSYKNGVNGNQIITVAGGVTGFVEDTVNTDALVAGDRFAIKQTTGTGTEIISSQLGGFVFEATTSGESLLFSGSQPGVSRSASATTHYWSLIGKTNSITNTTEAIVEITPGFAATVSKFRFYSSAYTYGAAATATIRKNQVDTALTASINGSGVKSDLTNSFTIDNNDTIALSIVGGSSGSITWEWHGLLLTESAAPAVAAIPYSRRARNYFLAR